MTEEELLVHITYLRNTVQEIHEAMLPLHERITRVELRSGYIAGIISIIGGALSVLIAMFTRSIGK